MSYIGTKKRTTVRPQPQPVERPIPLPQQPKQDPDRIEVPNWPVPQPVPITLPERVERSVFDGRK